MESLERRPVSTPLATGQGEARAAEQTLPLGSLAPIVMPATAPRGEQLNGEIGTDCEILRLAPAWIASQQLSPKIQQYAIAAINRPREERESRLLEDLFNLCPLVIDFKITEDVSGLSSSGPLDPKKEVSTARMAGVGTALSQLVEHDRVLAGVLKDYYSESTIKDADIAPGTLRRLIAFYQEQAERQDSPIGSLLKNESRDRANSSETAFLLGFVGPMLGLLAGGDNGAFDRLAISLRELLPNARSHSTALKDQNLSGGQVEFIERLVQSALSPGQVIEGNTEPPTSGSSAGWTRNIGQFIKRSFQSLWRPAKSEQRPSARQVKADKLLEGMLKRMLEKTQGPLEISGVEFEGRPAANFGYSWESPWKGGDGTETAMRKPAVVGIKGNGLDLCFRKELTFDGKTGTKQSEFVLSQGDGQSPSLVFITMYIEDDHHKRLGREYLVRYEYLTGNPNKEGEKILTTLETQNPSVINLASKIVNNLCYAAHKSACDRARREAEALQPNHDQLEDLPDL